MSYEYITDEQGNKKSVVVPINDFEEMLEDIEDLAVAAERRDEVTISHEEVAQNIYKARENE